MPGRKNIWIIDDDRRLCALLTDYLAPHGFTVSAFAAPREALRFLKQKTPDLVILDVMLPEMDGFAVCREIRKESTVPVIMLTARGEVTDRVVGLELGADDYLPKPFEPRELLARIQSVLRRGSAPETAEAVRYGALKVDFKTRDAYLEDAAAGLTTAEFELLSVFARAPQRVFDRDQLMDRLKGVEWEAFDRSIDVLVSRLRQKLKDDPRTPRYLKTVWGKGYQFIGRDAGGD
jgi:DNA-binding response OmpR family regulator